MTAGEDGLLTLKSRGLVPQGVAHLPEDTRRWADLVDTAKAILNDQHNFQTVVVDTGNGAERMLAESVCEEEFGGNWSEFGSYAAGEKNCVPHWSRWLGLLDQINKRRNMSIILIHHSTVKTVNNPTGKDWDQHRPEGMKTLWGLTHKWADAILYGGWKVRIQKVERGGDEKAVGEERYLQAGVSSAIVAGNRYGLPTEIMPKELGPAGMWKAFVNAMQPPPTESKNLPNTAGKKATTANKPAESTGNSIDDEIPFGKDGPAAAA